MTPIQRKAPPSAPRLPRFSSLAVANEFIELAAAGPRLKPRKLHDLVYLAQGIHLAETGCSLLSDSLTANADGVYANELREAGCWGAHAPDGPISRVCLDDARGVLCEQTPRIPPSAPVRKLIARVWKLWGTVDEFELHGFTREHGAPWDLIWNDEERPDDDPQALPNGTIRTWFREYASRVSPRPPRTGTGGDRGSTQRILARPDPDRLRVV